MIVDIVLFRDFVFKLSLVFRLFCVLLLDILDVWLFEIVNLFLIYFILELFVFFKGCLIFLLLDLGIFCCKFWIFFLFIDNCFVCLFDDLLLLFMFKFVLFSCFGLLLVEILLFFWMFCLFLVLFILFFIFKLKLEYLLVFFMLMLKCCGVLSLMVEIFELFDDLLIFLKFLFFFWGIIWFLWWVVWLCNFFLCFKRVNIIKL